MADLIRDLSLNTKWSLLGRLVYEKHFNRQPLQNNERGFSVLNLFAPFKMKSELQWVIIPQSCSYVKNKILSKWIKRFSEVRNNKYMFSYF